MICKSCDFLFLANPKWLLEAYKESFSCDTGHMLRNNYLAKKSILFFRIWQILTRSSNFEKCLDLGTGIGIYPRLMRDKGYLFYGFDQFSSMALIKPFVLFDKMVLKIRIKTSFEVIEHVPALPSFLRDKVGKVKLFFFSTKLRKVSEIPDFNWDYYNFEVGQHISFHSIKSLKVAFDKAGYNPDNLFSYGDSIHVFANTQDWRTAFFITKIIWRINTFFEKVYMKASCLLFKEKSLVIDDYIHSRNLIKINK
tara:strand:+ start:668 stop:1426 length:759 start_codon:yes stop_codon:yes gene_type:complete